MECSNLQIGQILCVSDPGGSSPPPESCKIYTVKPDDRCYYIAQDNGITVDELQKWNPDMNCFELQVGQNLCVSDPRGGSPPPGSCQIYTVKAGDECWSIAVHHFITEDELEGWNPGMDCSNLETGQILCVSDPRGGSSPPGSCETYTVKAGDRCWSIALYNGISVVELHWWNPDMDCSNLEIGEILCISDPKGGSPPPEPCKMYDVKAGDGCPSIALDNGIAVKDLERWNPGLDCSELEIGDILCVSEPYYYNGNIKAQRLMAREGKEEARHSVA